MGKKKHWLDKFDIFTSDRSKHNHNKHGKARSINMYVPPASTFGYVSKEERIRRLNEEIR